MFTNLNSADAQPRSRRSVAGRDHPRRLALRPYRPASTARNPHPPFGFTLIEVVVALTILAMITGTLFAIIQGSVRAAAQIELIQRENDSINRLLDVLRKTFTTLPSAAQLELVLTDENASDQQELTITGAPNTFGFGIKPISYSPTILGLRPDLQARTDEAGAPLYSLSLSREDLIPETSDNQMAIGQELDGVLAQDDQGRSWMPLLPDVSSLKWRFYKLSEDTWYEEWSESAWPDLIEIQLLMKDRLTPTRMVFGLPTLTLTPGTGTPATTPGATPTTTTSSAPASGGAPSTAPSTSRPSSSPQPSAQGGNR
jgi:prepilin-type N-terminal cleavage/methylation domain-containing protein